ncbi:MAG: metal-dependent hydrolase [Nitrosomonas sp.]|nr:metal-dependent hydrolase [Nitrosomonas sp.]
MDLLTQGLLGAALAQAGSKQQETRIATGVGFFAGLLADADILIQSDQDPLLTVEFHRHFTHSIFFVPFGALIAALILWFFLRHKLSFLRLYFYCFLGYSLSGVLDGLTSYGTHLFWPISQERVALNLISVIDPVFTLILLAGVIIAFRKKTKTFARISLFLAGLYLCIGWLQLQRAENMAAFLAQTRGHVIETSIVKPTLANLILWRSIYEMNGKFYVDAIRVGFFSEPKVYEGETIEKFIPGIHAPKLPEKSVLADDIERFTHFSAGYIGIQPERPHLLIDVRYSNLPTSTDPLWAIVIDLHRPDQHAQYQLFRDASHEIRQKFLAFLLGEHIN